MTSRVVFGTKQSVALQTAHLYLDGDKEQVRTLEAHNPQKSNRTTLAENFKGTQVLFDCCAQNTFRKREDCW